MSNSVNAQSDIRWVDNADGLTRLLEDIDQVSWFAIDTEFQRERTYYPQLCLIQIATPDVVACIDTLAEFDLSPLLDYLQDPKRVKVFHAARQDLEIFYHLSKKVPQPVFDTQLAAQVLGHADQIGYGKLVQIVLGIELSKSHSRADWTRRPLPEKQLEYAADDVIYLARIYPQMLESLQSMNRLEWLEEEFEYLTQADLYDIHPEKAWLKIKPAHKLKGARLSIVQQLASWRETLAKKIDQPRNWIVSNEVLLDLAHQQPATEKDLQHIRGLSDRSLRRNGNEILGIIKKAAAEVPAPKPENSRTKKPDMQQQATLHILEAILYKCCADHNISPIAIATRSELEKFMFEPDSSKLAQGWRFKVAGQYLQTFLQGQATISCNDTHITLENN